MLIPRDSSYHKFVKTTPKPSATKKRRGELGLPLPPSVLEDVVVAAAADEVWLGMPDWVWLSAQYVRNDHDDDRLIDAHAVRERSDKPHRAKSSPFR